MVQAPELEAVQGIVADLHASGRADEARALEKVLDVAASVLTSHPIPLRPHEYLTTGQAAAALGVSRQTIKNWVQASHLRGVQMGGRTLIHRDEVQAQLNRLLSARPTMPRPSVYDRGAVKTWHEASVNAVPADQIARLEVLHARMEDGETLSRAERVEMAALERSATRAATDALERRVREPRAPSA